MSNNSDFRNRYRLNDRNKERIYYKFVNEQTEQFELFINYINEILVILKDYRIVSRYTKMNARIKAAKSAINNDEKKSLDDVFGIEVVFATSGERDFVEELIKSTMTICRKKIHCKDNGYEAFHFSGFPSGKNSVVSAFEELINKTIDPEEEYKNYYEGLSANNRKKVNEEEEKYRNFFINFKDNLELYSSNIKDRIDVERMQDLKEELQEAEDLYLKRQRKLSSEPSSSENIPIIEFQGKTIEVEIEASFGRANHAEYKGKTNGEVQKEYDNKNGEVALSDVPTMYTSDLKRDVNGNVIEMRIRSVTKTLEVLYEGLITKMPKSKRTQRGE